MKISALCFFLLIFSFVCGQQAEVVDFLNIKVTVEPFPTSKSIKGKVTCTFNMLVDAPEVYLDAVAMKVTSVAHEGVQVRSEDSKIWLQGPFEAGRDYTAFFSYTAFPKQTLYFTGNQTWTQGQGKYTSHWLPSIDDMNDKIEFDLKVVSPKNVTVVANGALISSEMISVDKRIWEFDMKNPMSSYLVAFAIGDFHKNELLSSGGTSLRLFIDSKDLTKIEPTYRHTKAIFDFLETEIGVAYPWQNYKQVPVRDFLYAGMENTTSTFFSEAFVVDSIGFNDRNYVNVNAHELAHQWFGNLVTETEGSHHWLHEGFASFYALLAEKEIFGEDYYYWKLLQTAEQLKVLSNEGKGQSLLNPKASSLTFYEKGTWALHILRELIGADAFRLAVKNYLNNNAFENVTTQRFISEVKAVTSVDISSWEQQWLVQSAFQESEAFESLTKNVFINEYFSLKQLSTKAMTQKNAFFLTTLQNLNNDFIGQEIVYQLANEPIDETVAVYKEAFATDNLYVRQAIALSLQTIPEELKMDFESLLNDSSYITKEAALYALWAGFPKDQSNYLDSQEKVIGFQDKNVRTLWLTLALVTKDYRNSEKLSFQNELKSYTDPGYSFEVRERAYTYINELGIYDDYVLSNLLNASTHHNWRFKKYARSLLKNQLENPKYKAILVANFDDFSENEKNYLNTLLIK